MKNQINMILFAIKKFNKKIYNYKFKKIHELLLFCLFSIIKSNLYKK